MKSVKTVAALLVASTLGLGGVAMAASQDTDGDGSRRQAAERTGESRQRAREEGSRTADAGRRGERRQGQTATGDSGAGDRNRADRGDRRQARADNSGNDHGLGRREPQRARADQRTDRRHTNNGRYTGHDRRGQNRHNDRSHERKRYAGQDRRSHKGYNGRSDRNRYSGHDRRNEHGRTNGGRSAGFGHRVDRRLSNQHARIRQGRHSGELSRGEFKRLQKDQNRIARMDRRFGSDGRYTKVERRKLNKALDRASNRVSRAKNNDRVAMRSGGHKRNW